MPLKVCNSGESAVLIFTKLAATKLGTRSNENTRNLQMRLSIGDDGEGKRNQTEENKEGSEEAFVEISHKNIIQQKTARRRSFVATPLGVTRSNP